MKPRPRALTQRLLSHRSSPLLPLPKKAPKLLDDHRPGLERTLCPLWSLPLLSSSSGAPGVLREELQRERAGWDGAGGAGGGMSPVFEWLQQSQRCSLRCPEPFSEDKLHLHLSPTSELPHVPNPRNFQLAHPSLCAAKLKFLPLPGELFPLHFFKEFLLINY